MNQRADAACDKEQNDDLLGSFVADFAVQKRTDLHPDQGSRQHHRREQKSLFGKKIPCRIEEKAKEILKEKDKAGAEAKGVPVFRDPCQIGKK